MHTTEAWVTMNGDLGAELRKARQARGLSLRAVAAAVGISPSLLSQVETGKTHPSVSTLYAVVTYLGVSIDELVGNERPPAQAVPVESGGVAYPSQRVSPVQLAADAPRIEMENGVTWERLAVGGFGLVDPLITTYEPGGSSSVEGQLMRHTGIEYGYIIEGELTLKLDFDSYLLKAGDSLCFDSTRPHLYINHTSSRTRGLWIVLGRHEKLAGEVHTSLQGSPSDGARPMRSAVDVLSAFRED
jgi:transcriptional regulator with XRE-family HTH domain